MNDSDLGQLASTQEWFNTMGHDRAWSEGEDDIRREQERDARDDMAPIACAQCGTSIWTNFPEDTDALCGTCWEKLRP